MKYKVGDYVKCLPGRWSTGGDDDLNYGGYGYREGLAFRIKRIDENGNRKGRAVLWGEEIPNGGGIYVDAVELSSKDALSYAGNVLKFRFV